MTERKSSASPPARTTDPDELAAKIQEEIDRLRKKRSGLLDRIGRAERILVLHLSCPRQRPIKVRVRQGRPRFLVNGSGGSVYSVDPEAWTCSCPDFHRRGKGCKHALSCYVLVRASRPPKLPSCTACGGRFPHAELVEIMEDDESLTWFPGDKLCKSCLLECGGIS